MDVISHWLWGQGLTRNKISWKISGPMGVLPDLVAFIPASIVSWLSGRERVKVDDTTVTSDFPAIAWEIYKWSHSLFIVVVLFVCAYIWLQRKGHSKEECIQTSWLFILPWLIHIIIDIPGHSINFFPTPFLHPFSDFMVNGVRWSTWWFFGLNLIGLAVLWYEVLKREKDQKIGNKQNTSEST